MAPWPTVNRTVMSMTLHGYVRMLVHRDISITCSHIINAVPRSIFMSTSELLVHSVSSLKQRIHRTIQKYYLWKNATSVFLISAPKLACISSFLPSEMLTPHNIFTATSEMPVHHVSSPGQRIRFTLQKYHP